MARLVLLLLTTLCLTALPGQPSPASCASKHNNAEMEAFWINLDSSLDRRKHMEEHLAYHRLQSRRVPALTPNEIHVPTEIWTPDECKLLSSLSSSALAAPAGRSAEAEAAKLGDRAAAAQVIVDGHCGRPKNSKRELSVTASHLRALYLATRPSASSANASAPYALVLEDDMQLALSVDFGALVASAPAGWVILQLVTSNERDVIVLYSKYKVTSKLWHKRLDKNDFWCAGAYLVHRARLRAAVERVVRPLEGPQRAGQLVMTVLAGYSRPCFPRICCSDRPEAQRHEAAQHLLEHGYENIGKFVPGGTVWDAAPVDAAPGAGPVVASASANSSSGGGAGGGSGGGTTDTGTGTHAACVFAARGYQADHYLFSLARRNTYILTVPVIGGASVGNRSTLHQEHVNMLHVGAFHRIAAIQAELRAAIRAGKDRKGLFATC